MWKKNLVVPKICSSNDSSWLGSAKYALELWCFKNKELKRNWKGIENDGVNDVQFMHLGLFHT